jgi:HK97 family phage major capsid protein
MPILSAGTVPIAFGDFKKFYLIVDRIGMRTIVDQLTAKPFVLIYCYRRVGADVQDFNACKLMRVGTS